MIDVVNLQRKVPLDLKLLREFVTELTDKVPEAQNKTFSVAFISDKRMRELNKAFRGKDTTTDVLSFPFESEPPPAAGGQFAGQQDFLGDIVISAEQAQKQAAENNLTLDLELKQLILHGLLHLAGYDHETDDGEMNARELAFRDRMGIS
jgi:probable rRNA maturation factor